MSVKVGDLNMEWALLHIRNGEQLLGLVEVPPQHKEDNPDYFENMAESIMRGKLTMSDTDNIVPLRNPHQIMTSAGPQGMQVSPMPLSLGNKIIFLRAGEILYVQFMDQASPLLKKIMQAMSGIVVPETPGESRTGGGLILPGSKA